MRPGALRASSFTGPKTGRRASIRLQEAHPEDTGPAPDPVGAVEKAHTVLNSAASSRPWAFARGVRSQGRSHPAVVPALVVSSRAISFFLGVRTGRSLSRAFAPGVRTFFSGETGVYSDPAESEGGDERTASDTLSSANIRATKPCRVSRREMAGRRLPHTPRRTRAAALCFFVGVTYA